tara:strand:- start:640 stop:1938 length:1299 start_codon:yes stop_codon:yes gene_type:complete
MINKNVFCVGLGKLGLIFSFLLAEKGFKIYGHDVDEGIEIRIKKNIKDDEPKLNDLIKKNKKNFKFIKDYNHAINKTNYCFIILPTPSKKNKEFDNSYIFDCLGKMGEFLKNKNKYLINITSTVNPGSCNNFIKFLENKFNLKHGKEFIITYNPHLIALGSIYNDVLNSDLVILGSDIKEGHKYLMNFYKKIYSKNLNKLRKLKLTEAEVSKIAINSYITMKISFSNLISSISDKEENIDSSVILNTIGFDRRIGHKYLSLGAMFAGPCFPRDNLNFAKFLAKKNLNNSLPKVIDKINDLQFDRYINVYKKNKKFIKSVPKVGICGLSYKDNTPLTTRSPGEKLVNYFKNKNQVFIFDEFVNKTKIKNVKFTENLKELFEKSDIIFICYRHQKFKNLGKFVSKKNKLIIDLWNYIKIPTRTKRLKIIKLGIS